VQQQPEQLLAVESVLALTATRGSSIPCCWAIGVQFLARAAATAGEQDYDSAAARQMAANMTQQLDQSGEHCSFICSTLCDALLKHHAHTRSD
jgi:hypothetical protein